MIARYTMERVLHKVLYLGRTEMKTKKNTCKGTKVTTYKVLSNTEYEEKRITGNVAGYLRETKEMLVRRSSQTGQK